jgi:hypothetical protein
MRRRSSTGIGSSALRSSRYTQVKRRSSWTASSRNVTESRASSGGELTVRARVRSRPSTGAANPADGRGSEQVALRCVEAELTERREVLWSLDAFPDHGRAEFAGEGHERGHRGAPTAILGHPVDQPAIDLDEVWPQFQNMAQ